MAALAPWKRDQSSTAPSRTGVVSTASMPGFEGGAVMSLAKPTPGRSGPAKVTPQSTMIHSRRVSGP